MNQPIIYFKDNQLDKYRTCKSLLRYYFREWAAGRTPARIIVLTSVDDDLSTAL